MMTYRVKRVLWGLVFVAIGIGYLGTQLEWWDFTIFFPGWWTMLLILPAVYSMLDHGLHFYNILAALAGAYFLADANAWIDVKFTYPVWMAIICIAIGLRLLCTRRVRWYEYRAHEYND